MSRHRGVFSSLRERAQNVSPIVVGTVVIGLVLLGGFAAFQKAAITTFFTPGDTIQVEFAQGYKMEPYQSDVTIADVTVGVVTAVESTPTETALITMKLDSGTLEKLGDTPSAIISATTLLGGVYYVDLIPGGTGTFTDELIPRDRTATPVELGDALTAFSPGALDSIPTTISKFESTLQLGGRDAIRALVTEAPPALRPTGEVLTALRGTQPQTDLTELVDGLRTVSVGLLRNQGQLGLLFEDLDQATAALAAGSRPLAESIRTSPETQRITRAGLTDLRSTLARLTESAEDIRPTARQLDSLFAELDPVLERARPVVNDLREVLEDARPLVDQLNPTADDLTDALDDLSGPVLDRVNGPIADGVLNPWRGTGVYEGGGSENRLYEEVGYLAVVGALDWQTHDGNTTLGRLTGAGGGQTFGGSAFPMTSEEYLETLGLNQPPGPQADAPEPTSGSPSPMMPPVEVPR